MQIKVKTTLNSIEKEERNPPAYQGSYGKHAVLKLRAEISNHLSTNYSDESYSDEPFSLLVGQ